jgi:hypothetical protein
MNFHGAMDFDLRMKEKIYAKKEMIIMSDEYSEYYTEPANSILEKMWQATVELNFACQKAEKEN